MGRRGLALVAAAVVAGMFLLRQTRGETPRWDVYGGLVVLALVIAAIPERSKGGG